MKKFFIPLSLLLMAALAPAQPLMAAQAPAAKEHHEGNRRGNNSHKDKKESKKADRSHSVNRGNHQATPKHDFKKNDFKKNANKKHDFKKNDNKKHDFKGNGHNDRDKHPGQNSGWRPTHNNHKTSAPKPGHNNNVKHHDNGWHNGWKDGHKAYKWRPFPKRPHRPKYIHHHHHARPSILGLALGTIFDIGLRSLNSAGYNVLYAANNVMALANINQYGVLWPEVQMFYGTGGVMNGARFSRYSNSYDLWAYNTAYSQLLSQYGQPESVTSTRNGTEAIWWCGGNSYITLTYAPMASTGGYATDLIFGN